MRYLIPLWASALALAACDMEPTPPTGAQLFAQNCAGCHGAEGRGAGPFWEGQGAKPPDLTTIARRSGGTFPMAEVLSTIDGFHRVQLSDSTMPEWGLIFGDATTQVDLGDGVMTPVSPELLAVADYLRSIQRAP